MTTGEENGNDDFRFKGDPRGIVVRIERSEPASVAERGEVTIAAVVSRGKHSLVDEPLWVQFTEDCVPYLEPQEVRPDGRVEIHIVDREPGRTYTYGASIVGTSIRTRPTRVTFPKKPADQRVPDKLDVQVVGRDDGNNTFLITVNDREGLPLLGKTVRIFDERGDKFQLFEGATNKDGTFDKPPAISCDIPGGCIRLLVKVDGMPKGKKVVVYGPSKYLKPPPIPKTMPVDEISRTPRGVVQAFRKGWQMSREELTAAAGNRTIKHHMSARNFMARMGARLRHNNNWQFATYIAIVACLVMFVPYADAPQQDGHRAYLNDHAQRIYNWADHREYVLDKVPGTASTVSYMARKVWWLIAGLPMRVALLFSILGVAWYAFRDEFHNLHRGVRIRLAERMEGTLDLPDPDERAQKHEGSTSKTWTQHFFMDAARDFLFDMMAPWRKRR